MLLLNSAETIPTTEFLDNAIEVAENMLTHCERVSMTDKNLSGLHTHTHTHTHTHDSLETCSLQPLYSGSGVCSVMPHAVVFKEPQVPASCYAIQIHNDCVNSIVAMLQHAPRQEFLVPNMDLHSLKLFFADFETGQTPSLLDPQATQPGFQLQLVGCYRSPSISGMCKVFEAFILKSHKLTWVPFSLHLDCHFFLGCANLLHYNNSLV